MKKKKKTQPTRKQKEAVLNAIALKTAIQRTFIENLDKPSSNDPDHDLQELVNDIYKEITKMFKLKLIVKI